MAIVKYLIIGILFAVMIFVILTLAIGPAFIEVRDWFRKRKQATSQSNRPRNR